MIIRLRVVVFSIFFICILISNSNATSIYQDEIEWGNGINDLNPIGQSFIAESQNYLRVGVFITSINSHLPPDPNITMKIFEGDGVFTTSALLLEEAFVNPSNGALSMDVSSIVFNMGSSYSFALYHDSYKFSVSGASGNPYSNGMTYGTSALSPQSHADLTFFVEDPLDLLSIGNTNGSSVPEPATMLLFGLGLIGFAGLNRKKQ